ncbi:MAG: cupredoxin domain-containing protein [Nitrosopumilaceae archaeon]
MRYSKIIIAAIIAIGVGTILLYTQRPFDTNYDYISNPKGNVSVMILKGASDDKCEKCYLPPVIKVVLGINNTVIWKNLDYVPSSVISDKGFFNSGPILPNQTWSFVFQKVGSFPYHSEPHPWVKGEVIVTKMEYAQ